MLLGPHLYAYTFKGVLGFSQGAAMAAVLAAVVSHQFC